MEQEDGLKNTEAQPVVREVRHVPTRWNSLGPKALSEMINDISEDCGLDREIVYILLIQQWVYTHKNEEGSSHWTKSHGN